MTATKTSIRPLADNVLVKRQEAESTVNGIIIPDNARKKQETALVVATGPGKKDKNGNIFRGQHIDIGSKNTLVWSDERLITTLGLNNIIIVDTKDALLVCRKDMSQDVKKVVGLLKQKNFKGQV